MKILNILLLAAVLAAATLPASAEVPRMTVTVDGMACPFCAYGLEKKLKGLEGVRGVKVELKTGIARLTLKEEAPPTVAAIREAVKKAGFTPKEIGITVVGSLQREGKQLLLRSRGEERSFRLRKAAGNPAFQPGEDGRILAVTGTLAEGGPRPDLTVETVEAVNRLSFGIRGEGCEDCAARLRKTLAARLPGFYRLDLDLEGGRLTVEILGAAPKEGAVPAILKEAGLEPAPDPAEPGR